MENYWIFVTLVMVMIVQGKPPSEILKFSIDCGTDIKSNNPSLHILTDVAVLGVARCHGGEKPFTTTDRVHYTLAASLTKNGRFCRLNQRENSDVYAIDVLIQYGEVGSMILTKKKIFSAVCTYSHHGKDLSAQHEIIDGPVAPIEWQTIIGKTIPAGDLKLSIQTVDDKDVVGGLNIDRRYSLHGVYTGNEQNVGLKPVSCNAVSRAGERYAVLRAGCGDGLIFSRGDGFKTTGYTFRSPYFEAFYLGGSADLSFECNVTLCSSGCEGSSCETVCGIVTDHRAVVNGSLVRCQGNNKYGDACIFTCDRGFDQDIGTNGTSVCGADGIWTIPTMNCTPKDCGSPRAPVSGKVSVVRTTYTNTATYTCSPGYDLVGNVSVSCLDTGSWETTPTCSPKDCGNITTATQNSEVNLTSTQFPSPASISCATGYRIVGPANNTVVSQTFNCLNTGSWAAMPTCEPKDCGNHTSNTPDGKVEVPSSLFPNPAAITCNTGYRISAAGNQVITRSFACLNTGSWAAAPTCEPKDCANITNTPTNSKLTVPSTLYPNQATITCDNGYKISGSADHVVTQTFGCLSSGSWDTIPTCTAKECGKPTGPVNGNVTATNTTYTSTATYTCSPGYDLVGNGTVSCSVTGVWGTAPTCSPKDCGNITATPNGELNVTSTQFPSLATISCATGYRIVGPANNTVVLQTFNCLNTGSWAALPTCEPKDCGNLTNIPANSSISVSSTLYPSQANITCDSGNRITGAGNKVITQSFACLSTGSWAAAPTCEPNKCSTPVSPVDGNVTATDKLATYTCNQGYRLHGAGNATCEAGKWKNTPPICISSINLALNKPSRMSSRLNNSDLFGPKKGNDGITQPGSYSSSNNNTGVDYWCVDLQNQYRIKMVKVFNIAIGGLENLRNFELRINSVSCGQYNLTTPFYVNNGTISPIYTVLTTGNVTGQYLYFGVQGFLNFRELEVY